MSNNHLDITASERKKLRAHRIKVKEIHLHPVDELQVMLDVSKIRAMELFALSEFQSLPSIGIRFAHDLISMGYYSLAQLRGKDPAALTDKFERQIGAWIDPCVEDQFRLVVNYANHPGSNKNWWDFTTERKAFRQKNGYPPTRPQTPWFELPAYKPAGRVEAASESTRDELHKKLKRSIALMKKDLDRPLTIKELSETAGLSQYHFLRCFKSAYETTPGQFLTRLRLKKASQLLRSNLDMDHIIVACGFEDKSSFIRLFRRNFKVTPGEYKKSVTKKALTNSLT